MTESKKQLAPNALAAVEFTRKEYFAIVPADTTVEEMLVPGYWGHVAAQLREHDQITVVSDDKAWLYQFYVRWARRLEASVSLIARIELERPVIDESVSNEYEIKFRGQRSRWTILRGKDVLKDGFESENQARAYLQDHLKAMAA